MRGGWVCLAFLLGGGAVGSAVCEEETGLGTNAGRVLFVEKNFRILARWRRDLK
jgi:hypothetical protein